MKEGSDFQNGEAFDVLVVGAGLAGLSTAYELCHKGKRVLILERNPYAGGRLSVILGDAERRADERAEALLSVVLEGLRALGVTPKGNLVGVRKIAEKDAFYSLTTGSQRLRPPQKTGIEGLVLCGDYTHTSSMATMEGAVLSGRRAARVIPS